MYKYLDQRLKQAVLEIYRVFQEYRALKFDELNAMSKVRELYDALEKINRKAYQDIADHYYESEPHGDESLHDLWLEEVLATPSRVMKYSYNSEVVRKRDRLMEALIAECGKDLDVYAGNDDQLIPALKLGATGGISVYSNLFPEQMSRLYRLFVNESRTLADQTQRALLPYYKALFLEVNPIPVKYAASLMGLCQAEYRLPLCPPSEDCCRQLKKLFGGTPEKNS